MERRAIVIGASSGIGREVARLLMADGWTVGVAARREERLKDLGHDVISADLVNRGYGKAGVDFLGCDDITTYGEDIHCIVTNPPYKYAKGFVLKSLEILPLDGLVCMFLKTTFAEGKGRYNDLFSIYPPQLVLQCVERVLCAKNGDFEGMMRGGGSAVAYAWWIWRKGYKGKTILDWV